MNQTPLRAELVRVIYAPDVEPPVDPGAFRRRGERVASFEALPLPSGETLLLEDSLTGGADKVPFGATLRYGVRVLDRRGRPSALVVAPDLIPIAFGPAPIGLTGQAIAEGVSLSWTVPPGAGSLQYNLYRQAMGDPAPRRPLNAQPISGTEFRDQTIEVGNRYRYEVRVVLFPGSPYREGPPSVAKVILAADRFPPAAPDGLVVVREGRGIRLFWNPGPERDLAGYIVYCRVDDGEWLRLNDEPLATPSYLDRDPLVGHAKSYRVTAVDAAANPNESPPSAEESVELGSRTPVRNAPDD